MDGNMKKTIISIVVLTFVMAAAFAEAQDTNTLTVSANVVGTCKFNSNASTLAFGALDPSLTTNATASTTTSFWCTKGASYSLTDDDGLYDTGVNANRMRHAIDATEFIPYTLTYTPTSGTGTGKTTPTTMTIDGTIANAAYVNALAGDYADTVVVTINP